MNSSLKKWTERRSVDTNQRPNDHRDPYQRDRARILHSAAFRRLQAKTQILGVGQDDFYRTRLTHSLEVAQIGTGLIAQLKQLKEVTKSNELKSIIPSDSLIDSLCLAHDIGHPPFGHGGEVALNYVMQGVGGFEANGQTLRIVSSLEPYTETLGMDLTRRSLLGLIKYPQYIRSNRNYIKPSDKPHAYLKSSDWKSTKGIFGTEKKVFNWVLDPLEQTDKDLFCTSVSFESTDVMPYLQTKSIYKSFDASIMELADDIAYAVHDLEDAIVLENVTYEQWASHVLVHLKTIDNPWSKKHAEQLSKMLFSQHHHERKNAIGALVNHLITSLTIEVTNESFIEPLLKFNVSLNEMAKPVLSLLKSFVLEYVIKTTNIQQIEFKGQQMLIQMYAAFDSDPMRLLPKQQSSEYMLLENDALKKRLICDFLANMSDVQASRTFNQMFTV